MGRIMDPNIVGAHHYDIARDVKKILQDYKSLQDIIAILGMGELSAEEKLTVTRARKIKRFTMILDGEMDSIPEVAFYMVGDIEEVRTKAAEIAASVAADAENL